MPCSRPQAAGCALQASRSCHSKATQDILISGIGTGLDLPHLPPGHTYTGLDLTAAMLERVKPRIGNLQMSLVQGNSMALPFAERMLRPRRAASNPGDCSRWTCLSARNGARIEARRQRADTGQISQAGRNRAVEAHAESIVPASRDAARCRV